MPREDHVAGGEGDDCIWMSGCIVQKLVDLAHGIFRGGCLLGGDEAKGGKNHAVDCTDVGEEIPECFLYYSFFAVVSGGEESSFSIYYNVCPYFCLTCRWG